MVYWGSTRRPKKLALSADRLEHAGRGKKCYYSCLTIDGGGGGREFAEESQKTWIESICVTSMQEVTRYSGTGLQVQGIIRKNQIDRQIEEKEEEKNEK